MKTIDFSTYKFRCSGLKNLMVKSRSKDPLSESTKTYLRDIYIKETFGRSKPDVSTGATKKGTMVESDSLDLFKEVTGDTHFKNNKEFENDFIKGTPDVVTPDRVIDVKSNWDIWTFAAVDQKKAGDSYYYQVLGYMWLCERQTSELAFALVDTPESIIQKELYRLSYTIPDLLDGGEIENQIRKNYLFEDIEPALRLKRFSFEYSQQDIESLKNQILLARDYLQGMIL